MDIETIEKLFCDATNSYNFPRDIASVSPREIKRFAYLIIDECNKEELKMGKKQDSTRIVSEIGVDPNPTEPGSYNVEVDNIMFSMPEYCKFDGEKWDIPTHFQGRRIWWYNVRYGE